MKNLKKYLAFIMCFSIIASMANVVPMVVAYEGASVEFYNDQDIPTDLGENLIAGEMPMYGEFNSISAPNSVTEVLYPGSANITNGKTGDSSDFSGIRFAKSNEDGTTTFYDDGSVYYKIIYHLEKTIDIEKICLINHKNETLVTGMYEIYASRYRHELFSKDSKIIGVNNTENYNFKQIITCSDIKNINYFALKIIRPCSDSPKGGIGNAYPRISELCIYGDEHEKREVIPQIENSCEKTNVSTSFEGSQLLDLKDPGKNFLYGKNETNGGIRSSYTQWYSEWVWDYSTDSGRYEQVHRTMQYTTITQTADNVSKLTDGDVSTAGQCRYSFISHDGTSHIDDDDYYVDLLFDAGDEQELGLFYIKHHPTKALRTMHYRVYAFNELRPDDSHYLYKDSDIIADCVNYSGVQDHYITVAKGHTVKARYYLIRIFNPCYDYTAGVLQGDNAKTNAFLRLNEVAAFTVDSISGFLDFDEDKYKFYDSENEYLCGIKSGTTVNSLVNEFCGVGAFSVVDKNGNPKVPSDKIKGGDKVVADTGYGEESTANIAVEYDFNYSGTHTVSDVLVARKAVLNGTKDPAILAAGDSDFDQKIKVTDVVATIDAIVNGVDYTESADPFQIGQYTVQKNGKATEDTRRVTVDTKTVLNEDFIGFGTNSFPSTLATEVQEKIGFNMVYNELNAERLSTLSLGTSRMWFQVDWMVTNTCNYEDYADDPYANPDYINYSKGVYDFESQWMEAVYEYLDMLKVAGTDVEINFGWKTATRIQDWFGTPCDDPKVSAPKDLDAFADAAASLIKELYRRDYNNVKAITFYNEPNLADFESGTDDAFYWRQLVNKASDKLYQFNLAEKVEIWGPECGVVETEIHRDWLQYQINENILTEAVDVWTGHHYYKKGDLVNNYSIAFDTYVILSEMTNRNMIITEMQGHVSDTNYKNWFSWNDSTTSQFIAASNTGLKGTFNWTTVGGYLPDPLNQTNYNDNVAAWEVPFNEERAKAVKRVFYEESLLSNYVPKGSKVLYTGWTGDDIRTSAYLWPDGENMTVLVENNGYFSGTASYTNDGVEKDIEIKINDGKTREFKRISYVAETQVIDANATVNSPDKTITANGGVITDTLGENYSVHIYTTAPIIKQVQIKDANITRRIKAGATTQITAERIDCDEDDKIVYRISEYTGTAPGTVNANGLYTAAADAKTGDMVALRASLESDPSVFAVVIIYIS